MVWLSAQLSLPWGRALALREGINPPIRRINDENSAMQVIARARAGMRAPALGNG